MVYRNDPLLYAAFRDRSFFVGPEKPMWFLTEPRVSEAEISDVVKYNRENGVIVGFGDMSPNGYPDRLMYTGDFSGAARRAICDELERFADGRVTTHA